MGLRAKFFMCVVLFSSVFAHSAFAQQAASSSVQLPASVVSQALDMFSASTPSGVLTGKVTAVSGTVKLRNVKTIFWEECALGREVREGDNIRTEKDGQVKIEFSNGNVLFLKANSQIHLKTVRVDEDSGKYETVIKTQKARMKAEVNDRERLKSFEIHTPVVVAGARGTVFYVTATPASSEVFVERGAVVVRNVISGHEREIPTGLATMADKTGKVAEPAPPEPQKLQEFQAAWQPSPLPPRIGPNGAPLPPPPQPGTLPPPPPPINTLDIIQQIDDQWSTTTDALSDRAASQDADKASYINSPPPPLGDFDLDWLNDADEINVFHTNTSLIDTDADGLTDWQEARIQSTHPLLDDSDADGALDRLDAFPNDSAIMLESRAVIRDHRYDKVDNVVGLRADIATMLADMAERQKDYLMDKISDAQIHKVLRDSAGSWVRLEEYVFRPAPNKIAVMSLSYRTSAQLTSMMWETTFQGNLDGLTSQQIRNLPWDVYLGAPPNYGATAPVNYPTAMTVDFERSLAPADRLRVERSYGPASFDTGASAFTQATVESVSGVASGSPFGSTAYATGGLMVPGNPVSFSYDWGIPIDQHAYFDIHVIDDSGTHVGGPFLFDSLWTVLGANLPGFSNIGNATYIEIQVSFNAQSWSIIYKPIRNLVWRGTPEWEPQLTW